MNGQAKSANAGNGVQSPALLPIVGRQRLDD
jgi:hypothetical protein